LIFPPSEEENKVIAELEDLHENVSEMSIAERQFLSGLIRRYRPKNLLELGVSAGCSSSAILNTIRDQPTAKLYSIDYHDYWYRDQRKKVGYFLDTIRVLLKNGSYLPVDWLGSSCMILAME
jgi:predicted O-methyltransferase YrrM